MNNSLNAICPYFTMFPIDYPDKIIAEHGSPNSVVLDPFCGRGTTNFSARAHGLKSIGIDVSPVACAISESKLANTTPEKIASLADKILSNESDPEVPEGEFWKQMYDSDTLNDICKLRNFLIDNHDTDEERALRGIVMGALHGRLNKGPPTYFSNQFPRTYASKPDYAVRFWEKRELVPPKVDSLSLIKVKAERYYSTDIPDGGGAIINSDSTDKASYETVTKIAKNGVDLIITSPPYYGMNTYVADQWVRNWFVGGPSTVEYTMKGQVSTGGKKGFRDKLESVWNNCKDISSDKAKLFIRFGAINSVESNPEELIMSSLENTGWEIIQTELAGVPKSNTRQANTFVKEIRNSKIEFDIVCALEKG
ncbi:MAG: DNA methyltransferase [Candidatus Methanomethylophilus sp.]|nr:DNA methyltransferase [Methanomethylophilus sp.]